MTIENKLDDARRAASVAPESGRSTVPELECAPTHRPRDLLLSGGAYLVISIFVWWNVWTGDPGSTTTCGCGDSAAAIWVMEWPAFALTHGGNLLYSTAMNHPTGVNLVAVQGALALSLPLLPVTWLFGPVASLNVVLTLTPALSALAMFLLLRRWVSWAPAAFFGGLFYGFCPFILVGLTQGWITLGMGACLPLIVLCLDELLLRQRRRPERVGVGLGLLVALQFFVSAEILVTIAIIAVCGIGLIIVYVALKCPNSFARNTRYALVGLSAAAVTSVCLLVYPVWFAVAGPGHFNGLLWPKGIPPYNNVFLRYFVHPAPLSLVFPVKLLGGYQGTARSLQYFGAGVIIVVLLGLVVWRRDRRLWFFAMITVLSGALSLAHYGALPFIENLIPGRFVLITYFSVAALLSLTVDHTHRSISRLWVAHRGEFQVAGVRSRFRFPSRLVGAIVAVIVAAIAIVPPATYLASTIPITTQRVVLPKWFEIVAPHLQGKQVFFVFPTYFVEGAESPIAWQAVGGMRYSLVNGNGSGGSVFRAGKERPGASVIARTVSADSAENLKSRGVLAVRKALLAWGVTKIVIPDQANLPLYDRTPSVVAAAALMTAATGEQPIHQADAWIWSADRFAPSAAPITGTQVRECTIGDATREVLTVAEVTECELKSATP